MKSLSMRVAWWLPPKVLLWAVVRAFALADSTTGYKIVYDAVVKKYKIDEHNI